MAQPHHYYHLVFKTYRAADKRWVVILKSVKVAFMIFAALCFVGIFASL